MKGVLAFLGWPEAHRRKLNHNFTCLAEAIIAERPAVNNEPLRRACGNFPSYVNARYNAHGLTRIQLMELGMRAQFVAGEALRRISSRNIVATIEADNSSPPREIP
ncbi:hypothetical protein SAMN05216417_11415 [Nitrosospira multiformis]|uniref:Uncharacterized protein n=1 Tax=Nitrosospira multiformis TaxID=1231 RepID=A0A1I7I3Z8_9PROT|nr:hypothetical protein SAMN05216417_11415 [Nitrosospira multiformis]